MQKPSSGFLYNECGLKGPVGHQQRREGAARELASRGRSWRSTISSTGYTLSTGMLAAAMGGIDAFVFTAGIGENAASHSRPPSCGAFPGFGLELDASRQCQRRAPDFATGARASPCYVIPTDEELMIARHTLRVLRSSMLPSSGETRMIDVVLAGAAQGQEGARNRHRQRSIDRLGVRQGLSCASAPRLPSPISTTSRNPTSNPLAKEIKAPIFMPLDLQREGQLEAVFDEITSSMGQARSVPAFDRLCAQAGFAGPRRRLLESRVPAWQWRSPAGRSSGWPSWPSP